MLALGLLSSFGLQLDRVEKVSSLVAGSNSVGVVAPALDPWFSVFIELPPPIDARKASREILNRP